MVLIKEYKIHLVSSCGDRVFWRRRRYSSKSTKLIWYLLVEIESAGGDGGTHQKSTKFIWYLLVEIESSGEDGGTHQRVRNTFGIFLWR